MKWEFIDKRHVAIDQFKQGLRYLGFWNRMKDHHKLLRSLFVYSSAYCVTADYVKRYLIPVVQHACTNASPKKHHTVCEYMVKLLTELSGG